MWNTRRPGFIYGNLFEMSAPHCHAAADYDILGIAVVEVADLPSQIIRGSPPLSLRGTRRSPFEVIPIKC